MASSLLLPGVADNPAPAGWGVVCSFQAKSALLYGVFMLEFSSTPLMLRQVRVLTSPVPRFLSDINIDRAWADIDFHFIKKTREPKWLAADLMNRLTNEFKWAGEKGEWCKTIRTLCESGRQEELRAECHKTMGKVLDVLPEFRVRYVRDINAETAEEVVAEESAAPVPAAQVTLVVNPQSDPLRGMMISELRPGDEVFVKILDETPRGLAVREQLGGVDEEGKLRAVACPFRELRPLDDRGNFSLAVGLAEGVVGVAEVYQSVKVKTTRSMLAAAVSAPAAGPSGDDDAAPGAAALPPWVIVIAAALVLMVAAFLLKSFTG